MTSVHRLGELQVEARYRRERLELYRAKDRNSRSTSVADLRQRERECEFAEKRYRRAQQRLARRAETEVWET